MILLLWSYYIHIDLDNFMLFFILHDNGFDIKQLTGDLSTFSFKELHKNMAFNIYELQKLMEYLNFQGLSILNWVTSDFSNFFPWLFQKDK